MTPSLFLRTASKLLFPMFLLLGAYFFLRGHNAPGGGFIAGLLLAGAFVVRAVAFDVEDARRALRLPSPAWIALGLFFACASAWVSVLRGSPFMTGVWLGPLGTPMLFDFGVLMVVVGIATWIAFNLLEE
jgi:multicomponent Na+:H+ antiporter subunit B